jgi:hypothetical protein
MMGGRRTKLTRRSRKLKGGDGYGAAGAIAPGAMEWGHSNTSAPYSSATGSAIPDPFSTTGGRRRKSRKSKKAGRKTRRRRTMKGGSWTPTNVNSAGVGYGFGPGSTVTRGPTDASPYASRMGGAPMNAAGVRSA